MARYRPSIKCPACGKELHFKYNPLTELQKIMMWVGDNGGEYEQCDCGKSLILEDGVPEEMIKRLNELSTKNKLPNMGTITTNPNDERLGHGIDEKPVPQNDAYLVLSEEERAKGFIRPVRNSYMHVGKPGPKRELRDLTDEEKKRTEGTGYIKFEPYPEGGNSTGRYWRQEQIDAIGKGCQAVTTMGAALSETYARDPKFYGATYCCHCMKHLAVDEFIWEGTNERVGS